MLKTWPLSASFITSERRRLHLETPALHAGCARRTSAQSRVASIGGCTLSADEPAMTLASAAPVGAGDYGLEAAPCEPKGEVGETQGRLPPRSGRGSGRPSPRRPGRRRRRCTPNASGGREKTPILDAISRIEGGTRNALVATEHGDRLYERGSRPHGGAVAGAT